VKTDGFVCLACDKRKSGQMVFVDWQGKFGLASRVVRVCRKCSQETFVNFWLDVHFHDNLEYYISIEQ